MIFLNSGFFLYDENIYNEKQKSSKCMLKLLHHKRKMTSFCFSENDIHRNLKYRAITKISYWHYVISRDSDDEINSQLRRYLSTWFILLLRYFLWVKFVFYRIGNHIDIVNQIKTLLYLFYFIILEIQKLYLSCLCWHSITPKLCSTKGNLWS